MKLQAVGAKQVVTVNKGEDKGLFVTNLNEQIAFSFVVLGGCGGIGVQPELSQLENIFSVYNTGFSEKRYAFSHILPESLCLYGFQIPQWF